MAFNIKKKITDFHYGKKSALLAALFILPTLFYFLFIISFFAVFYMYKTPKILPTVKRFRNIIAMLKFYIKYR